MSAKTKTTHRLEINHTSMCHNTCGAEMAGLQISQEMIDHGVYGKWVAYYLHDIGEGGLDFQVVAEAETKDALLAAIAKAEVRS